MDCFKADFESADSESRSRESWEIRVSRLSNSSDICDSVAFCSSVGSAGMLGVWEYCEYVWKRVSVYNTLVQGGRDKDEARLELQQESWAIHTSVSNFLVCCLSCAHPPPVEEAIVFVKCFVEVRVMVVSHYTRSLVRAGTLMFCQALSCDASSQPR